MNQHHTKLYADLMALCQESTEKKDNCFYYIDQMRLNHLFRIFMYRLARYTDFKKDGALSCRGLMYEMDRDTMEPVRCASFPMDKFFNKDENPDTMDIDYATTRAVYAKHDGSLISTYLIYGDITEVYVKSKGSLASEQAIAAEQYVRDNPAFESELRGLACLDFTVNMEYCAPTNRIVLAYDAPVLHVIDVRQNDTGYTFYPHDWLNDLNMRRKYPEITNRMIPDVSKSVDKDKTKFVESIPKMENIEGYVILVRPGKRIKIKTEWYLIRHKLKDSVNNPKALLEAIITEQVDDIRVLFAGDELTQKIISDMENKVIPLYNGLLADTANFHEKNKTLSRKDYAILAQEMNNGRLPLYMNAYLGRQNDFKEWTLKHYKEFIGDVSISSSVDD